ncbi:uncharacterized protein LOC131040858 isoform X1 [Cryptomeria japonica]|uniref:uncharacterized protein LOC131040858 isoform X1 n=1 Tax=Cryptomeria japonica TaxID=3369 RepID=UPI0027DA77F2|nr:uncharacterized protein LOC131040858 isoform X1 [Cryptomeria japonica]
MAYVENGMVKEKRPVWRLSYLFRLFWSILNLIGIFITTMLSTIRSKMHRILCDEGPHRTLNFVRWMQHNNIRKNLDHVGVVGMVVLVEVVQVVVMVLLDHLVAWIVCKKLIKVLLLHVTLVVSHIKELNHFKVEYEIGNSYNTINGF